MHSLPQQIDQLMAAYTQDLVRLLKAAILETVTGVAASTDGASRPAVSAPAKKAAAPRKKAARAKAAKPAKTVTTKAVAAPKAPEAKKPEAAKAKPAKAAKAEGRTKGVKRDPAVIARTTAALLAYVKSHPNQRIEQIGAGMGTPTKDLALPAKKLLADKKLKTKGQKRATTYAPA